MLAERTDKVQLAHAPQRIERPHAAAEVEIVRAAAHRHMLAMVDGLASGLVDERTGAAAEIRANTVVLGTVPPVGARLIDAA